MSKKPPPVKAIPPRSIEEINEAHWKSWKEARHELWEQEKEIEQRNPLRYAKLRIALEDAQPKYILRALGQIRKHDLDEHDLAVATIALVGADSDDQSKKAQRPRPKTKPTHRSIAITAMKAWRKKTCTALSDSGPLADFLNEASEGCDDGLTIVALNRPGVEYFDVDSDKLDAPKRISYRTILGWWNEAKN